MGVTLGGIHFHCGSGQNGASNFKEAVWKARECIQLGRAVGHPMDMMDIGGGLPADRLGTEVLQAL
jgi:ornithine decarboxylase